MSELPSSRGRQGEWPLERVEAAARLWQEGWSARHIGERLGVSRNAVFGMAHRKQWTRGEPTDEVKAAGASAQAKTRQKKITEVAPRQANFVLVNKLKKRSRLPVAAGGVPLLELGHGCKWPLSGSGSEIRFCGQPRQVGASYCPEHQLHSVQPGWPPRIRVGL